VKRKPFLSAVTLAGAYLCQSCYTCAYTVQKILLWIQNRD